MLFFKKKIVLIFYQPNPKHPPKTIPKQTQPTSTKLDPSHIIIIHHKHHQNP